MKTIPYSLIAAHTPEPRNECINLGLILWQPDGIRIHHAVSVERLRAFHPDYPMLGIFRHLLDGTLEDTLNAQLQSAEPPAWKMLVELAISPARLVSDGTIYLREKELLEERINLILERFVARPVRTLREDRKKPAKLDDELARWFRSLKLLASSHKQLSRGKIVRDLLVSEQSDLYAEFAYKNGRLKVIETLDVRSHVQLNQTIRKTAALKSLTLEAALEERDAVPYGVVYSADPSTARPLVNMLSRHAKDIFELGSQEDRQRFVDTLSRDLSVNTTQHPLNLQ